MPSKKKIAKTTISDAQLHQELIKLFESGNTSKTNLYELLRTKHKIAKQRCLKAFDLAMKEWQQLKEKATSEQVQANTVEQLKTAVMSKRERLEYLTKIAKGEVKVLKPFVIRGKIMEYKAEPDFYDRKQAIAELNKMEGDYAPSKVAQTDVAGNDLPPTININQYIFDESLEIKENES
jgi:hypothetical protein